MKTDNDKDDVKQSVTTDAIRLSVDGTDVGIDAEAITFEDLFDLEEIQRLQDLLAEATGVACQILRPDGTFITGRSNYCRLCGDIIRGNEKGLAKCNESDTSLGELNLDGPNIYHCRSAGFLEAGAPICVGGQHIATWGLGQVCDGAQTEAGIRAYAREIGADEDAAADAFQEVTVMSRERFEKVGRMMYAIANQLAKIGYQNIQQTRLMAERKDAEAVVQTAHDRLEVAVAGGGLGAWEWVIPTGETVLNDRWQTMLGFEPGEVEQRLECAHALTDPEALPRLHKLMRAHLDGETPYYEAVYRMRHKSGKWVWIHDRGQVTERSSDGAPLRVCGTHADVTPLMQAEEGLRESEERFRSLVEFSPQYIFLAQKGQFIYGNPAGLKAIGYESNEDIIGLDVLQIIAPEFRKIVSNRLENIEAKKSNPQIEIKMMNRKGEPLWVISSSVSVDLDGKRTAVIALQDITDMKKLESQLIQSRKMEAIGTLAGGIAHEFNNVLAIILGNAELAVDDIPDWNPARESLKEIYTASIRGKEVVRQILSFARKTMTALTPLDLNPIAKESLKLMRASIPTMIEIKPNISAEPKMILSDSTEIHQIFINLCTNAAHAMKETGGVLEVGISDLTLNQVAVSRYEDLSPGHFVRLTVSDSGEGISSDVLEKVFEPSFTTKAFGDGSGMGLAVVYGIVKKCNGAIKIESAVGKGTTVEVLFPKIEEAPAKAEQEGELPAGNERILLVDDDPAIVNMIRHMLKRLGYSVSGMTDSNAALERFKSTPDGFDLVITDMSMPKMSGDRLAVEMMKIRNDVPILLCTGHSDTVDEKKAKEIGIKGFAMKPLDKGKLARAVRRTLENNME